MRRRDLIAGFSELERVDRRLVEHERQLAKFGTWRQFGVARRTRHRWRYSAIPVGRRQHSQSERGESDARRNHIQQQHQELHDRAGNGRHASNERRRRPSFNSSRRGKPLDHRPDDALEQSCHRCRRRQCAHDRWRNKRSWQVADEDRRWDSDAQRRQHFHRRHHRLGRITHRSNRRFDRRKLDDRRRQHGHSGGERRPRKPA